jgi:galactokinase
VPDSAEIVIRFVAHRTLEGSGYADRVRECAAAESRIGPLHLADAATVDAIDDPVLAARARHVVGENLRVRAFADAFGRGDLVEAGRLMNDSHASLRDQYAVSTPIVDAAVADLQRTPGVFGARMTGGGFGGCVVALCRPGLGLDGWVVRPVAGATLLS